MYRNRRILPDNRIRRKPRLGRRLPIHLHNNRGTISKAEQIRSGQQPPNDTEIEPLYKIGQIIEHKNNILGRQDLYLILSLERTEVVYREKTTLSYNYRLLNLKTGDIKDGHPRVINRYYNPLEEGVLAGGAPHG